MAKQVRFRAGSSADHSNFTGAASEVTVDSDKKVLIVHDGSTQGGYELVGTAVTQTLTNKTIGDGLSVSGVVTSTGIQGIGIQSGGVNITTGVITAFNFVGSGNTFGYNSTTKTVDINIGGSQWTFVDSSNTSTSSIYRVNGNIGIGTTNPVTPLHISDGNGGISTALYTSDYLTISAQNTAPGFNIIAAGSADGQRGVFKATRARGTLSSPTVPLNNDDTFSLLGAIYDGSTGRATAAVNMEVDGDVGVGTAPQRITFWTGTGSSRLERVRITSSGNVGIGTTNTGAKLNVVDNSSSDAVRITQTGSGNALVVEDSTNPDATPFIVGAAGSVGIGTTNPTTALEINGVLGFNNTNTRIGGNTTGASITSGTNNNFIGVGAGYITNTGSSNNFIGINAGFSNQNGSSNNFLGSGSGYTNTSGTGNNFFGLNAGLNNSSGGSNNFFGVAAGISNQTGSNNIFLGARNGISASASYKVILGSGYLDNYFDSPDTTKDYQFAVGIRTDANASKYWLVGDENFNIGIGTTRPVGQLQVSTGPIIVGSATSTGTASQRFQVTGGGYFSGNVGIGTTIATEALSVLPKLQILNNSNADGRIILRAKPGNSYRWNIDNDGSTNDLRFFREDDADAANGTVPLSITPTGNATLSGNLNAAGNYFVKIARTSNQTITSGADTLIGFSTVTDSNGWFNASNNRITPTVAGNYYISAMVNWAAGSATNVVQSNIQIRKTGTTIALSQIGIQTHPYTMNVCAIATLNGSTDYIEFTAYTGNPTSQVVSGDATGTLTKLELFKLN